MQPRFSRDGRKPENAEREENMGQDKATVMPSFSIGQAVKATGFVSSSGEVIPERTGLTIASMKLVESEYIDPYYRYVAVRGNGLGYVEGSARFFAPAD